MKQATPNHTYKIEMDRHSGLYHVLKDGKQVGDPVATRTTAARRIEKLQASAKLRRRACLTCQQTFISEGPHNRRCDKCRSLSVYSGRA